MKSFLRSIFKGTAPDDSEPSTDSPASAPATCVDSPETPPESGPAHLSNRSPDESTQVPGVSDVSDVIDDLRAFICSSVPDPMSPDEVDPMMHMYDAGYVTSITAADLLAHVETRYGMDVSETQLIGRLQTLDALARHIVSPG
jgi:hypothetical protein